MLNKTLLVVVFDKPAPHVGYVSFRHGYKTK